MIPPASRMGPLTPEELARRLSASAQVKEYATAVDRQSAREMLAERMTPAGAAVGGAESQPGAPAPRRGGREPDSPLEQILKSPLTRTVAGVVTRGIMGALLGSPSRRRRSYF
jgi:hypothetical protein